MKYQNPFGTTDPDGAYINGDPSIGRQGSIPPAGSIEFPQREVVGVIAKSLMTPSDLDLLQLTKAVRSQRLNYAEDTGSVNALSVAYDPPLTAYTLGLILHVKVLASNTGPSTINAGGGVVAIKKPNGSALAALDLPGGSIAGLVYDGTAFQMLNFGGAGGGPGSVFNVKIPYCVDTSGTPGIITAPFSPAITVLGAGDYIAVKLANTIPGATVINVNALPAKNVLANGGPTLLQGDAIAGDIVLFAYDGTSFYIVPSPVISANITINVPSQFATVPLALAAIKRKTIAPTALVTIAVGTSVIAPFKINHHNADRILIKGTMLAAAPNVLTFAQTGSSLGARVADSANNIAMLRTRYGTEIQCPAGQYGIENVGPGVPVVQDMLITGPNFFSCQAMGVRSDIARVISCTNVAVWGCDNGWYGGGFFYCSNCFAVGNWGYGWLCTGPGGAGLGTCAALGNNIGGIISNQNAMIGTFQCTASQNGSIGAGTSDAGQLSFNSSVALGNAAFDLTASTISELIATGAIFSTTSPASGVVGNYGAVIIVI